MILSFPKGYDTPVGEGGMILVGRPAPAHRTCPRRLWQPFLVVLDEPNSNLDPVGEQSLNEAIQRMRLKGQIVVIVAHRPSAIFAANKILSLRNGRAEMFGSKKHVLAALFPRAGQPHKPAEVVNGGESGARAGAQSADVAARSDVSSAATRRACGARWRRHNRAWPEGAEASGRCDGLHSARGASRIIVHRDGAANAAPAAAADRRMR